MTTPNSDEADGPTLQAVLDAVIERNESHERTTSALESLSLVLADNTAELRRTQSLLDTRPTKEDVAYHRRRAAGMVAVLAFILIWSHDAHIERCSPGARVVAGIDYLLATPVNPKQTADQRQAEFERRYNITPAECDLTFPLHTHSGADWPTGYNLLGMGTYGLVAVLMSGWVWIGYRNKVRRERRERAAEPRNRRTGDRDPKNPS